MRGLRLNWQTTGERWKARDYGPQTGLISCMGSCQGQVQPPRVQETRVATKPQQQRREGQPFDDLPKIQRAAGDLQLKKSVFPPNL